MFPLAQRQLRGAAVSGSSRLLSSLSFQAFGEPSAILKVGETIAADSLSAGHVKVAVKACPVTTEDIRRLKGLSTHSSSVGIGGMYGVGTVSAVGSGVVGVSPSSQVFVASSEGTWNSEALLSSQQVFAIDLPDISQAACLPEAASAWAMLHNFATLSTGDVVVRSAEESAVNVAIDQIGKTLGVVVVPASNADLVDTKFKEKVSAKGPVKLALSSGTGKAARAMLALTGRSGVLVTYNAATPPLDDALTGIEVPSLSLIFKDQKVCGFNFMSWVNGSPLEASQAISESAKLIRDGKLKLSPLNFKAAQFAEALQAAGSGKSAVIEL